MIHDLAATYAALALLAAWGILQCWLPLALLTSLVFLGMGCARGYARLRTERRSAWLW